MVRKGERLICIIIVLLAVLSALPAATITWSWVPNDADVSYYRYRFDEGEWTTVDSATTQYIQKATDSTQDYTLYLQQSYDGENWSESTAGTTKKTEEIIKEETVVVAVEETIMPEEQKSIKFSILLKSGVSERTSFSPFTFENGTDFMRINIGTALDVTNLIKAGKHFSFGLRSDFCTDIVIGQDLNGWKDISKDNFYKLQASYDYDTSMDLKVMSEAHFGIARIYLGGGIGYSLFNQAATDEALETHTLKIIRVFGTEFDSAWFVSGITGVSLNITDLLSLGTELSYRYMLPASGHIFSADLVVGFTF